MWGVESFSRHKDIQLSFRFNLVFDQEKKSLECFRFSYFHSVNSILLKTCQIRYDERTSGIDFQNKKKTQFSFIIYLCRWKKLPFNIREKLDFINLQYPYFKWF